MVGSSVAGPKEKEADAEKSAPPKAEAPGGVDPAADVAKLAEANAAMRSLLQRMGAGLGAAATAILAGLGWTKLKDIFPIPKNVATWTWIALIAAVVAAVLGSAWLATIFFAAQRRILIGTTDKSRKGLGSADTQTVDRVLKEHAREELAPNLLDVEQRALRLERIARSLMKTSKGRAKTLQDEADRLYDFVVIALHRAASTVLEDRSRRAFFGFPTFAALFLAASGILGTIAIASYYKGERDLSELQAKCAKNEKDFPNACAPFESSADAKKRKLVQKAQDAADKVKEAKSAAALSEAQRKLLAAATACDEAISKDLAEPDRAQIVGLCAALSK